MRTVPYRQLPAMGDEALDQNGSLLQFVLALPYLFAFGLIPPLAVLNGIFQTGADRRGMSGGCEWEPFTIEPPEYEELVQELLACAEGNYRLIPPPEWVSSRLDWHVWTMAYELGVPHETHAALTRENEKWDRLKAEALQAGSEELAMTYHLRGLEAGSRLSQFLESYMVAYRAKKKHSCTETY